MAGLCGMAGRASSVGDALVASREAGPRETDRTGAAMRRMVPGSGIYVLLLELGKDKRIRVGQLGALSFKRGYYAYVGSGKRGLEKRIERHLRKRKRIRWHVDYLLRSARVVDVVVVETEKNLECQLAEELSNEFQPVRGFGSSDCRCPSHLFYSPSLSELRRAARKALGGDGL